MKRVMLVIVALAAVALGYVVARDRPTADQQAVQFRQALMTVIAGVTDQLFLMQRGQEVYDDALVRRHAAQLVTLSGMVGEAFSRDTRSSRHLQSAALPFVWSAPDSFAADARSMQSDAAALQKVAQDEQPAHVRAAIQAIEADCARCHRQFRAN